MDKTYTLVAGISNKLNAYRANPEIHGLVLLSMALYPHADDMEGFDKAFKSLKKMNKEYTFLHEYYKNVLRYFDNDDINAVFSFIKSAFDGKIVKYSAFEMLNAKYNDRNRLFGTFNAVFILNMLEDISIENQDSISDISGEGIFMRAIAGMLRKKNNEKPLLIVHAKDDLARFEILCNMAMNNYMNFTITDTPVYEAQLLIVFPMITHRKIIVNKKFINTVIENFNNGDELLILDTFSLLTSERGRYAREQLLDNNLLKAAISAGRGCMRNSGMELGILHIGENDSRKIEIAHYERMHKSLRRREKSVPVKQIKEKDFNLHYRHYLKVQQENSISAGELLEDIRENGMKIDEFIKKAYREISNI